MDDWNSDVVPDCYQKIWSSFPTWAEEGVVVVSECDFFLLFSCILVKGTS